MLKIWHCLNYKGYLCVQRKTNAFLDVHGHFWNFQEVLQTRNMLQLDVKRCASISPVCRYVWTRISVKILHQCDDTSLAVTPIAVSLTL